MLSIDTTLLKQLVNAVQTSNNTIHEATELLNQVVVHNDWGCSERNQINEFTLQNKNMVKELQEENDNFLRVMNEVLDEFERVEAELPNMFDSVDRVIGEIISIPTPGDTVIGSMTKTILEYIPDTKPDWDRRSQNLRKALDGIRIINFAEMSFH